MNCSFCGMKIKKGEMFVSVGAYPSWWTMWGARWVGPGYFGELYHEACYLELLKKRDLREEQKSEALPEKSPRLKEEQPSNQPARKRLVR